MARTMSDLHEKLFNTLDGLSDGSIDVEKAKAISEVAQTIINGAKVEVDFIKATGQSKASGLLTGSPADLPPGVTGSRTHRIR